MVSVFTRSTFDGSKSNGTSCQSLPTPAFTSSWTVNSSPFVTPSVPCGSSKIFGPLVPQPASRSTTTASAGARRVLIRSERQRQRLLEQLADARQELRPVGSVEDAVVAHERQRHRVARDDPAALLDCRPLLQRADGEER